MSKAVSGSRKTSDKKRTYLTKRTTASAARRAFKEAAEDTMRIMGYNVIAKEGWVVKIDKSGKVIEKISKITGYNKQGQIHLD